MNVLVTATTFPRWKNDKIPYFVYDLCQEYLKHQINVVVLAPHHEGAKFFEEFGKIKVYRFPYFFPLKYQQLCYEGGILGNLKKSLLAKTQIPFFLLCDLVWMIYIVKKEKIDAIHSHWLLSQGLIASIVSLIARVKHLSTFHAGDLALLENIPLRRFLASFVYANTNIITIVSNHGLRRFEMILKKENLKKLSILPMGVHVSSFRKTTGIVALRKKYGITEKNVLLFVGRLSEKKGVNNLLTVMAKVIIRKPNTKLIIIGDGPERIQLEEYSKRMSLDKNTHFTGFLSGKQKIDYFNLSDILIIPSVQTIEGDVEGLPVVLLEGLASKIAIIASDVGGISEIIINHKNGVLVEQGNLIQLENEILSLIENEYRLNTLKSNAWDTAVKYDWKKIGTKYANVLKELIIIK